MKRRDKLEKPAPPAFPLGYLNYTTLFGYEDTLNFAQSAFASTLTLLISRASTFIFKS